jgi:5-methylcytosine-specific restriction endonuclease McrA
MRTKSLIVLLCVCLSISAKQNRSEAAKNAFKRDNPCPANSSTRGSCPGYVIDHIVPLACGGADSKENMQWQTVQDGKIKDKFELGMCGK